MNENVYGSSPFGTDFAHSLKMIERIEIVRGPNATLYGAGAVFAVINIVTKSGSDIDGGTASAEYGTGNRRVGSLLLGTAIGSSADLLLSGTWGKIDGADLYYKEYDDPSTHNGIAHQLDWDQFYGIAAFLSTEDVKIQSSYSSRQKGIPTASWETIFNDPRAQSRDDWGSVEAKYTKTVAPSLQVQLRAYGDYYYYDGVYPYDTVETDFSKGLSAGSELQLQWDSHSFNRITAGVEVRRNSIARYALRYGDDEWFRMDIPSTNYSLYCQDTYQMTDNISITGGIRADKYAENAWMTSPRVAFLFSPEQHGTLKLLYGESFRQPTIYEMFYQDGMFNKANPGLLSEKFRTLEATFELLITKNIFGTLSLFQNTMTGLIEEIPDAADSLLQFRNSGEAKARGLEAEVNGRWTDGIAATLSYSFQSAKDEHTGLTLSNSPAHLAKANFSIQASSDILLTLQGRWESGRIALDRSTIPAFFLCNSYVKFRPKHAVYEATVLIRNVFNTAYSYPGGHEHLQAAIPQDGRQFVIGLAIHF